MLDFNCGNSYVFDLPGYNTMLKDSKLLQNIGNQLQKQSTMTPLGVVLILSFNNIYLLVS